MCVAIHVVFLLSQVARHRRRIWRLEREFEGDKLSKRLARIIRRISSHRLAQRVNDDWVGLRGRPASQAISGLQWSQFQHLSCERLILQLFLGRFWLRWRAYYRGNFIEFIHDGFGVVEEDCVSFQLRLQSTHLTGRDVS
ncbi:hypothetical protein ASD86_25085 [Lysobacter sp. Root690]|nr:hypothetical protein ASD86_25085 [Lysobacter sp. Root690]